MDEGGRDMIRECNNCGVNKCDRSKQPLTIILERLDKLGCFASINRTVQLQYCVSRVVIENPNNPAIKFFKYYQKGR